MAYSSMEYAIQSKLGDSHNISQSQNNISIDPLGNFYLEADHSTFMGNRGNLEGRSGQIARKSQSMAWIACDLGRKKLERESLSPVKYTRLFFLDEVTALAAGHRPCGLCRGPDLKLFKDAITVGNSIRPPTQKIDRVLRKQCWSTSRRIFTMRVGSLPVGSMFKLSDNPNITVVKSEHAFLIWSPKGYIPTGNIPEHRLAKVLTPKIIVHALNNGYRPCFHVSAY